MRTTIGLLASALALSSVLAGCASGDGGEGSPELSATEHNAADVTFASDLIQHHAQALAMVDMSMGRDLEPEVLALAEEIRQAQGREIETMSDWLTDWDEPVPTTVRDHASSEGHGAGDGGDEGLAALERAGDAEFQDAWLELMIEHHEEAVALARTEQAEGLHKPAVDLAAAVEKAQRAEIERMQQLRG